MRCPRCAHEYDDWYRASINLDLDDSDDDYLREASTATCPDCGHAAHFHACDAELGWWLRLWHRRRHCCCIYRPWVAP